MNKLRNKVALVTGASRGIGRSIARRLGEEGAVVAVHYFSNQADAKETVAEIERSGGSGFTVQANLGSTEGIHVLYSELDRELSERFGNTDMDILVNNAGMAHVAAIEDTEEHAFDQLMALNVKTPFFIIQEALSRLRNEGRIIQLSSAVARISLPMIPAYSMTKGAINTLTLSLANQLGPRGITINAIAPGYVATDMNAGMLQDPDGRKAGADFSIFGRWGEPEDIADIAAFLASPDSRWITGQIIDASGGSHL